MENNIDINQYIQFDEKVVTHNLFENKFIADGVSKHNKLSNNSRGMKMKPLNLELIFQTIILKDSIDQMVFRVLDDFKDGVTDGLFMELEVRLTKLIITKVMTLV